MSFYFPHKSLQCIKISIIYINIIYKIIKVKEICFFKYLVNTDFYFIFRYNFYWRRLQCTAKQLAYSEFLHCSSLYHNFHHYDHETKWNEKIMQQTKCRIWRVNMTMQIIYDLKLYYSLTSEINPLYNIPKLYSFLIFISYIHC